MIGHNEIRCSLENVYHCISEDIGMKFNLVKSEHVGSSGKREKVLSWINGEIENEVNKMGSSFKEANEILVLISRDLKPCRNLSSCTLFDMFDQSWKGRNVLEGDEETIASSDPFMSVECESNLTPWKYFFASLVMRLVDAFRSQ